MRPTRARPLADLVGPVLGPALARQGFSGTDVVASWPEIAGERYGPVSRPLRIEWPKRRGEVGDRPAPATLVLGVESAYALELQHLAPVLIARINAVYGWQCIGRIVLKQGPVATRVSPNPVEPPVLGPDQERRITDAVAAVDAPSLRTALDRLGRAVVRRAILGGGGREPRP